MLGPPSAVLEAFGADRSSLRRLPGGAGQTWTDGRLVLKPVGCVPEHDWVCEVYAGWQDRAVRVPEPVAPQGRDEQGRDEQRRDEQSWSYDGWGAHVFVPGRDADPLHDLGRIRDASDAFHHSIRALPRPAFIEVRDDPWAFGDRLAWEGAAPQGDRETLDVIERLRAHLAPVPNEPQVIHGDILPNVLLADGRPPAVIDWPPYFRPVEMADAVTVTDVVTFRQAPLRLLQDWERGEHWRQLLVRALLYRLGPTAIFAARGRLMGPLVTHVQRVSPVVDAVLAM